MIDWNGVHGSLTIARSGSLAAVSRTLKVNHSVVFRRLNALGDALAFRWFEQLQDGYAPNPEGESIRA